MKRNLIFALLFAFTLAGCPGEGSDLEADANGFSCTKTFIGKEQNVRELDFESLEKSPDGKVVIKGYRLRESSQTAGVKNVCENEFGVKAVVPDELIEKLPNLGN
jgi:hypothetical protein